MPENTPKPDEFGRFRVLDKDTGARRSVTASQLPHGNYDVLSDAASDVAGDALPVEYPSAPKSLSSSTPSGQPADTTTKEKAHG